jgi:Holliday junction DNA helicase RuvB
MTTKLDLQGLAARVGIPITGRVPEVLHTDPEPIPTRTHRPAKNVEMIGQEKIRVQLAMLLQAAKKRGEQPPHILFHGPPGLGKTTLAEIVASETGGRLVRTTASAVNSPFKIAQELAPLQDGDVIFVDEVHGLSKITTELLYTAMEDGRIEVSTGKGERTRSISVTLNAFVLVAATTAPGKLDPAFRGRFGFVASLEYYSAEALGTIIARVAAKKGLTLAEGAALALGRRSRGTPRHALHLLQSALEYATVMAEDGDEAVIDKDAVADSLALAGIDGLGLTPDDRRFLTTLCVDHMGGPVGLANLSNSIGVDMPTVVGMIEPFLLRAGLIKRGSRGRWPRRLPIITWDSPPRSRWPGQSDLALGGRSRFRRRHWARASLASHPPPDDCAHAPREHRLVRPERPPRAPVACPHVRSQAQGRPLRGDLAWFQEGDRRGPHPASASRRARGRSRGSALTGGPD